MKDLGPNEWVVGSDIYTDTYKTFVNTTCSVFEGSYIRGIALYTNYLQTFWCFESNYSTLTNYTISSVRQSDRCYGLTGLAFPVDGYLFGLKMEWNYVCNDNQKKAMDASRNFKVGDILDAALAIQYACSSDEGSILQLFSKYFADGCAALSSALSVGSLLGLDVTNESKKKKIEVGLITHCYESNIHYDSYPTTDAFQEFIQINGASANVSSDYSMIDRTTASTTAQLNSGESDNYFWAAIYDSASKTSDILQLYDFVINSHLSSTNYDLKYTASNITSQGSLFDVIRSKTGLLVYDIRNNQQNWQVLMCESNVVLLSHGGKSLFCVRWDSSFIVLFISVFFTFLKVLSIDMCSSSFFLSWSDSRLFFFNMKPENKKRDRKMSEGKKAYQGSRRSTCL
ncbi:hypothetical protein RFI_02473 [Reticulomyxa filosa]|uniref:Uncharacterized protein n=1 Tax=Reticulomyxa filosa TaxID=46433 RepID=X6PAE3_RETFI|nr:hypothetical protein RFI_02473 [Reticulomyxa filosa]|eukprot:ETO34617.1 hypothetical protein RFI_02473 [Reticulomyxa filosa]